MDGGSQDGTFRCHPECLKRSYWRRVLLEIEAEIHGLTLGQYAELVLAVDDAESETWWEDRPATPIGRKAAVELWVRGWSADQTDTAFGFPHGATERVLEEARMHPKARDVVAAHLDGDPPSRISRDAGVGIPTVMSILEGIGEKPHRLRDREKGADLNRAIQRLYGDGRSYREIADRLGISESNVRQRLQYLRRKGRLEGPPRTAASRRPRAAG